MAEITASRDLGRRVPVPRSRDEVADLAGTTNQTLAALEESVERQRRFVADASHELRSPLASLRTQLEVAAAHPELLDLPGVIDDAVRLQQLTTDLLLLARLDAGERAADTTVVLAELLEEELESRAESDRVPARSVVEASAGTVRVRGGRSHLRRVLGNLLDNAQRHASGEVTVTLRAAGDRVVLAVADDGSGVPPGDRERIFERFVRLDQARDRDEGGAGLGLAIARDVVQAHGGTLTVREAAGGGASFEVRLPAE
ncbi:sensor histidine kinase [Actinomadura barringtoniae]|uniref:sensor histidine kinase n=1 Tax=Actinomadura barringtoniae TaxID=1427535 RepID=UPI003FD853E0